MLLFLFLSFFPSSMELVESTGILRTGLGCPCGSRTQGGSPTLRDQSFTGSSPSVKSGVQMATLDHGHMACSLWTAIRNALSEQDACRPQGPGVPASNHDISSYKSRLRMR